ncbi:MAG: hypothetical protein QMD65_03665 [Patescibacteria group bacterium]|nr:hypothetical protein [Patescibacteria group bacterium]
MTVKYPAENKKIVIIGAGEIGRAIEKVLQNKSGIHIDLWDKNPAKVPGQKPLAEIVPLADFLFLCVPSWAMREVLNSVLAISNGVNKKTIVISLAKGIEEKTLKTTDEILKELLPNNTAYALLIGPMLAEELMQEMAGIGVVASKDRKAFDKIKTLFIDTNLKLEYSADVRGVALAGALKNIYAIGLGIIDSFNLGGNFKGWFVQKAIKEMAEIIGILGGDKKTVFSPAGLGDLIATGFSPYSRNRQLGDELVSSHVKDLDVKMKSEGIVSLPSIIKLLAPYTTCCCTGFAPHNKLSAFPILQALEEIIIQHKNAKEIFEKLAA